MIIGLSGYASSGKNTVATVIQYLLCNNVGSLTIENIIKDYKHHQWWLEDQSGWKQKAWAGKLKTIASLLTGIPVDKFEDQEFKKTVLGPEWNTVDYLYRFNAPFTNGDESIPVEITEVSKQMTVREFLQKLGTDGLRTGLHPNTWVNALMADYKNVWNDPDPVPGNDYTITYRKNYGDTSLIHYGGGSEAEVFNHEITEPNWIITDTRFPNEAQAIKDAGGIVIRVDRPGITAINAHPSETALDNWNFDHVITNDGPLGLLVMRVHNILKRENLIHD